VLSSTGLIGVLLARSALLSFPLVFLIGSARAPSLVGYSILSTVRSWTVRVLSDAGERGVCIWILSGRYSLHSEPHKHFLRNFSIIHSTRTPCLVELREQSRILTRQSEEGIPRLLQSRKIQRPIVSEQATLSYSASLFTLAFA
jgi:hypothetical protein